MINIRHIVLSSFLSILSLQLNAQFAERIGSGRPGNANAAFSVGKGVYQVQFGQNMIRTSNSFDEGYEDFAAKERVFSGPDVMFRIGIKEDVELRFGGIYSFSEKVKYSNSELDTDLDGMNSVFLGIRSTLFQQKGIFPATAIQFTTDFGGSGDYKQDLPNAGFRVNFTNKLTEKLNLNWNFISRWVPDNSDVNGFYIFSFSYPITDDLSATAEIFGGIDETTKVNTGFGLSYIIGNDFQLDAYGSYGSNQIERGHIENEVVAINAGISYRLVYRDN